MRESRVRKRRRIFRRRRRRPSLIWLLAAAVTGVMGFSLVEGGTRGSDQGPALPVALAEPSPAHEPRPDPAAAIERSAVRDQRARVDRAREVAEPAPGLVSFALADGEGKVRGYREHATYESASIVKAMLLAAETRRLHAAREPLDASTESLLRSMITYSDNDAATTIYSRVGDAGLYDVAERAGMTDFSVSISWGWADVSAADMALFFADLDGAFPREHREFAKGLLGSIVPEQSWGIPAVAGQRWNVRFKGGWRPSELGEIVHQAAELRDGDEALAIAVLTDGQPSMEAGIDVVETVASRLLSD